MDKKTEIRLLQQRQSLQTKSGLATRPAALTATGPGAQIAEGWWMYHGDQAHTGYVSGSNIKSDTVAKSLQTLYTIPIGGPILSVPAIVDGFAYVGVANYLR